MYETDWDFWNNLQNSDRKAYDLAKEQVAAQTIDRLEKHYPGISDQVEMTDVATPWTTYRYTRNYKGAWMGWQIDPKTIMTKIKRTAPGLDNFYMAGQWVIPGGGVPTCLASGKDAVMIMCKRDGVTFQAKEP